MPPLEDYRARRRHGRTPEPIPTATAVPRGRDDVFVIQEHHARSLHWDFRLERDGVLVSWALPKGVPADPRTNHLAVHTEDHPLEYADFAGEIPPGEYGGGAVTTWDRGRYETEKWADREVKVVLHGSRVEGRYVLFATGGRNWMIHRMDPPVGGGEPPPQRIAPMLAVPAKELPRDDAAWAYEFKWDGVRAVVYVDGGRARAYSRNDREITASYPELRAMAETIGARRAILDGELVALGPNGAPSFAALQSRMHLTRAEHVRAAAAKVPVCYFCFDLLYLDGRLLLDLPYDERRRLLDSLELSGERWRTPPSFPGEGAAVRAAAKDQGLEGVVAKRRTARYEPGRRSGNWLKIKKFDTQEVVVGGWRPGAGRRADTIGSLLLGIPGETGLDYVGRVGTGFSDAALADLAGRLAPLARRTSPFAAPLPRPDARDARWVRPTLVGEVAFSEWTRDGRLRQPAWRGLRADKDPGQVAREA